MAKRATRNFPSYTLEFSLAVAQKIQDEMAGQPFKRLLLSEALGIKPGSSNFRYLLSSSYKYGLTEGTEKASEISLTSVGRDATQTSDATKRTAALRKAAMTPPVFGNFYSAYLDRKIPSTGMMEKILSTEYKVPSEHAGECAQIIIENGNFVDIIRDIGGSPHVLIDAQSIIDTEEEREEPQEEDDPEEAGETSPESIGAVVDPPSKAAKDAGPPRAIFVGHGKNQAPLEKLQKILTSFQIPHKVVVQEANLGRPISQKVKETMLECGSAILIFTRDEKFLDENGNELWRPSENVVYELGAASYAYEDSVVIFKEKGIHFPTNFQNIGYIEFEEDSIEAKTMELLKELIGFGLVKLTTA